MRQPDIRPETFQISFQTAERDHLHAFLCSNIWWWDELISAEILLGFPGLQIPSEFGSALKIKRRGGVLLWEHRGWMLHMAFSYKAKNIAYNSTLSYALTYSNLLPPTSQRLAVHPLSPERETFEPLPLSIQIYSVRLRCLFSPRYLYLRQKMYIYYFMLYLAESLTVQSYTERKLIRHFPLWRERGTIEDGGK